MGKFAFGKRTANKWTAAEGNFAEITSFKSTVFKSGKSKDARGKRTIFKPFTILRWIKQGFLPAIRFGREFRVKKENLEKYGKFDKRKKG